MISVMQEPQGTGQVCARKHVKAGHALHSVPKRLIGLLLGCKDLNCPELLCRQAVPARLTLWTERVAGSNRYAAPLPKLLRNAIDWRMSSRR